MIEICNIGKRFGEKTVFWNLSMVARPGELVGVIGSSGSGKSTLLKCINGMLTLDAGNIRVGEFTLRAGAAVHNGTAVSVRRKVGMVFQHLNLWPYKTALENIIEGAVHVRGFNKGKAVDLATTWARKLGIEDQLSKYPPKLSGGQRQRVAIARALMMEPEFLLLDEITSALDPVLAGEIIEILVQLKEQGMGILFVSHQIDFIRRNADQVHFLHDGTFKESGQPQEVLAEPRTLELRSFIESVRHGW